jgi:hypothetical protein
LKRDADGFAIAKASVNNERTFFWGRKGKKRFDNNKHFSPCKNSMQYTPEAAFGHNFRLPVPGCWFGVPVPGAGFRDWELENRNSGNKLSALVSGSVLNVGSGYSTPGPPLGFGLKT